MRYGRNSIYEKRGVYAAASAVPPLPTFDAVAAYGLFNWNPVGWGGAFCLSANSGALDGTFSTAAPYPMIWTPFISPPYTVSNLNDHNSAIQNNLSASGSLAPTLNTVSKRIEFDGVDDSLSGDAMMTASDAGTLLLDFAPQNLSGGGFIFGSADTGDITAARSVYLSMNGAGNLRATGVLFGGNNSKQIPLSNTNRIFVAVTWNTTLAAADQIQLYVNNSQTGMTAPESTNLASGGMASQGTLMGNQTDIGPCQFHLWNALAFDRVLTGPELTAYYNRAVYLRTV